MVSSVDLGLVFSVLRDFKIVQCHCAVFVEVFGSLQLFARQKLVGDSLAVVANSRPTRRRCARAAALDLFDGVAKARMDRPQRGRKPA